MQIYIPNKFELCNALLFILFIYFFGILLPNAKDGKPNYLKLKPTNIVTKQHVIHAVIMRNLLRSFATLSVPSQQQIKISKG